MKRSIRIWLYIGVVMILIQIVIGGVTRLTGSGLSITRWEIVTGTLPPMNDTEWKAEFQLYRDTPQYEKINEGMSLSEFKFIYFWEYLHRLWARLIGLVFLVPFIYYLSRGWIDRILLKKLIGVVLFGGLVASFGWIMVASGLIDRPWVNAYKLTLHLGLGTLLFVYMLYVAMSYDKGIRYLGITRSFPIGDYKILIFLIFLQILLGGLMSGMRAALLYPTWPEIDGSWIPIALTEMENWKWIHLTDYDKHPFAPALVQFLHRMMAYVILIYGSIVIINHLRRLSPAGKVIISTFGFLLITQVVLGILTLINSMGSIPLVLGVLHQLIGILLLGSIYYGILAYRYNISSFSDSNDLNALEDKERRQV